jgi:hypothetical protein
MTTSPLKYLKMNNQKLSEGLQILSKYFAIKTQSPEAIDSPEVPQSIPSLPQPITPMPIIQTPTVQVYEPIGRGRGPKILLASIVAVGLVYFLFKKYEYWNGERKHEKDEAI